MPPAPSGETISYGPILVPAVRAIRARNYSLHSKLPGIPPILDGLSANRKLSEKPGLAPVNWRKIAISLIDPRKGVLSVMACLHQLSLDSEPAGRTFSCYCSFAYSALASFRMGMSGSASFQSV